MLFDKICGVAEKGLPDLIPILKKCKLYHFDKPPHEFLPKDIDPEILVFLNDNFMLPFPIIAIEDAAGVVILQDDEINQKGANKKRHFIDVIRINTPSEMFTDPNGDDIDRSWKNQDGVTEQDPIILCYGTIEELNLVGPKIMSVQYLTKIIIAYTKPKSPNKIIHSVIEKSSIRNLSEEMIKGPMQNSVTAIQEIMFCNTPNKFILETSYVKKRKKENNQRIPRSPERPIYTLLTPSVIKKIIKEKETISVSKGNPVEYRRAHPRTFYHERFTNMRGKTIMIPAIWSGINEKIIGNRRYKVLLDK